jgi:hypothetical protein
MMFPALLAQSHCPGNIASLGLRFRLLDHSQIIIPVEINQTGPYDFLVDTGAQITTVDPSLVENLSLKPQGIAQVSGVAFQIRDSLTELDSLAASSHVVQNVLAVVQDLGELHAAAPSVRGILGGNFLRHFDLLIDYSHRLICLDDTRTMQSKVKGERIALLRSPVRDGNGESTEPMIVSAHLPTSETRELFFLLDSGTNAPVLFNGASLMPQASFLSSRSPRGGAPSDCKRQLFAVVPQRDIQIGNHLLHQIPFVTPIGGPKCEPRLNIDGVLPTALFERVYINYADHYAVLKPW